MGNRNATASAYGWVFQVGAGIYLMLEKVKDSRLPIYKIEILEKKLAK